MLVHMGPGFLQRGLGDTAKDDKFCLYSDENYALITQDIVRNPGILLL